MWFWRDKRARLLVLPALVAQLVFISVGQPRTPPWFSLTVLMYLSVAGYAGLLLRDRRMRRRELNSPR